MKKVVLLFQLLLFFYLSMHTNSLLSQEINDEHIFSEAPIFFYNNVKMSTQLTLNFRKNVFPLPKARRRPFYLI